MVQCMATHFEIGSTPEQIVSSSCELWGNSFGCFTLLEDAMAYSPACQFFSRDGNGLCVGTPLKKVQLVCTLRVGMLQAMLYPTENLQTWSEESGERPLTQGKR